MYSPKHPKLIVGGRRIRFISMQIGDSVFFFKLSLEGTTGNILETVKTHLDLKRLDSETLIWTSSVDFEDRQRIG